MNTNLSEEEIALILVSPSIRINLTANGSTHIYIPEGLLTANSITFSRCVIYGKLATSELLWSEVINDVSGTGPSLSPHSASTISRRRTMLRGEDGWAALKVFCAWCLTGDILRIEGTERLFDRGGKELRKILMILKEELVCVDAFGEAIEKEFAEKMKKVT